MNGTEELKLRLVRVPGDSPDFQLFTQMLKAMMSILNEDQEKRRSVLKELAEFQAEDGSFGFIMGKNVPSEARVDFVYTPTYIAAAIFMRELFNLEKGSEESSYIGILEKALAFCLGRGLRGHGYEAEKGMLEAIDIFRKGGLKNFLATAPNICPEFHAMIWQIIDRDLPEIMSIRKNSHWSDKSSIDALFLLQEIRPQKRLYLAYGSNMSTSRMMERCPQARFVGTTEIKNWELRFHYYADIEKRVGARTPTVVWEITNDDEVQLDYCEGFPKHYTKEYIVVQINDVNISAMAYVMTEWKKHEHPKAKLKPEEDYLAMIRRGYAEHGFKEELIRGES